MDKSFNDQELSDIMKEIEALEDSFPTEEKIEASPVMEELAEMSEEEAIPHTTASKPEAHVLPMSAPKAKMHTASHTSMNFKVSGDLNLELNFDVGGKVVALQVNEFGLNIQMEGGMTFSIPLKKSA